MNQNPRIRALASEAARRIKVLTEVHQTQIQEIYRDFREQVAEIQKGNVDELQTPNVAPDPKSQKN